MSVDWQRAAREALVGTANPGQYVSPTVVDRLITAVDATFAEIDARGIRDSVRTVAGEPTGHRPVSTLLDDLVAQTSERWTFDGGRHRTLAELAAQLEVNVAALAADQPAGGDPGGDDTGGDGPGSVVPAGATLVADLGFDNGNLSRWSNLQTRDRNGSPGTYSTYSASVRDGGPGHPTAARFEVRKGDVPNFGGGERSEVRAPSSTDVRDGDERWYSWSTRFGDADGPFPPPTQGWGCIVMQWHAGDGSPPLCLEATRNGKLAINNNRSGGYSRPVCPIDAGRWHDYVLRVRFSRSSSSGLVELWRDGQQLASYQAATMASDHNYLKTGLYRSSQTFAQVVWHDGLRVWRP